MTPVYAPPELADLGWTVTTTGCIGGTHPDGIGPMMAANSTNGSTAGTETAGAETSGETT